MRTIEEIQKFLDMADNEVAELEDELNTAQYRQFLLREELAETEEYTE